MKTYCRVEVCLHAILTLALDGGEWSASHPGRFILSVIAPGIHSIRDWVGSRVGLDAVVNGKNNINAPAGN
jgi:hypothetical protein